jgi:hypothetical protein
VAREGDDLTLNVESVQKRFARTYGFVDEDFGGSFDELLRDGQEFIKRSAKVLVHETICPREPLLHALDAFPDGYGRVRGKLLWGKYGLCASGRFNDTLSRGLVEWVQAHGLKVSKIIETHVHADHVTDLLQHLSRRDVVGMNMCLYDL